MRLNKDINLCLLTHKIYDLFLAQVSYEICEELKTVLQNTIKSEDVWPTSSLKEVLNKVGSFILKINDKFLRL